ncbi:MAG: alpha-1,3-mannosyltransferase family protein [Gemmataceae bacterium]|nr:alpha-1,3-mannosyltransferase family protein [Gemmataceae bacterium]
MCGWELKPYATLYSPFAQVLFLDADNGPVRDPIYLRHPQFDEHGAIFWPDCACWTLKPDVWQIFGMDWMVPQAQKEIAFESGQYLIDKTRCWRELRMALWYAEHSDYVFRVVYGDKECFHLARRFLGTEYAMGPHPPGWNQHTIVQYDFDGQVIFQHRCQDKWKLGGGNRRNNSLAN